MISSSNQIKDLAINFRVENKESGSRVISIDSIIEVFSDLKKSFSNFVQFQLNNQAFIDNTLNKDFNKKNFLQSNDLFVYDVKIGSLQASIAPNIDFDSMYFFGPGVMDLKKNTFLDYRNDVVYLNYYNEQEVDRIISKYPEESRAAIYKPFLETFSEKKEYNLILLNKDDVTVRRLIPVHENLRKKIVPGRQKYVVKEKLVKGYFTIASEDELTLKKPKIKKVIDLEVLEHETYPFKPDTIKFEDEIFVLNKKLFCEVEYNEDQYLIRNSELEIVVWGNTREEAEAAFNFSFYSLFKNFVEESDNNLSDKAVELKQKLQSLIIKHYSE